MAQFASQRSDPTPSVLIVYTAQAQPADRAVFHDALLRAVTAVPGVSHAAISLMTPISGLRMSAVVNLPDAPAASQADRTVNVNDASPGWFATYGTPWPVETLVVRIRLTRIIHEHLASMQSVCGENPVKQAVGLHEKRCAGR